MMRIIRLNGVTNFLKLEPSNIDDLYLLAMIISKNDVVEAHSTRRFRAHEGDTKGEQKDVTIRVNVERSEIDKNAGMLRVSGKIVYGQPEEYVTMGSYHTLNIASMDIIDIQKPEWKEYILRRIKQAVIDSKKPRMGIIVMDDEKALVAYIKGYGIEIVSELYSRLSKRMKMKDFEAKREEYFKDIIAAAQHLSVDIVVLAGPGFTKDDVKKYIEDRGVEVKKRLIYAASSDAERSGIREVMQSSTVTKFLENEHMKREFEYINMLLLQVRAGIAVYGAEKLMDSVGKKAVLAVLVNDDIINEERVKQVLDMADKLGIKIEIFNADDDAGIQLRNFSGIAAV